MDIDDNYHRLHNHHKTLRTNINRAAQRIKLSYTAWGPRRMAKLNRARVLWRVLRLTPLGGHETMCALGFPGP